VHKEAMRILERAGVCGVVEQLVYQEQSVRHCDGGSDPKPEFDVDTTVHRR
jgi:hypothetical protein